MKNKMRLLIEEFRRWYGLLSINELTTNEKLIEQIRLIEAMFSKMEAEVSS